MCSYEELVRNYVVSVAWLCRGVLLSDNVSLGKYKSVSLNNNKSFIFVTHAQLRTSFR